MPNQTTNLSEAVTPLPANFILAHYRFELEALSPLKLPPFKGSALRGGFGYTFKNLVCTAPIRCDKFCRLENRCPYGYVFETSPPDGAEVLRNFSGVSRPFIIQSPADGRTDIGPGETFDFGLTLIGAGINYLPYFIAVFRELGRSGLGLNRGRYALKQVEAIWPDGHREPVYRGADETIRVVDSVMTVETILTRTAGLPEDRITLDFLTPTRLKHTGKWVNQGPPFAVLINKVLSRISSLSYFHCGERFETDFRGLIDRAAGIEIAKSETRWQDWSRFSGRQKQRIEMGGLVGRITYEGDLRPYLPLLALGQWVHVGKGNVFGNGQYIVT